MAEYVSRQVAVYKTSKYLIELNDSLKPAAPYFTGHLHARGGSYSVSPGETAKEESSLIRITMIDYSGKSSGKDSLSVHYNAEPELIRWYFNRVSIGIYAFQDQRTKIFGEPNEKGLSTVTKLTVTRQEEYNGQIKTCPWVIQIENGWGVKVKRDNGSIYCKKGSYVPGPSVTANMTDYDFFAFFSQGVRYLDMVETRFVMLPMMNGLLNKLYSCIRNLFTGNQASQQGMQISQPRLVEPQTANAPVPIAPMSYEAACNVVVQIGDYAGWHLGDVAQKSPASLGWYMDRCKQSDPVLYEAAGVLLRARKNRSA